MAAYARSGSISPIDRYSTRIPKWIQHPVAGATGPLRGRLTRRRLAFLLLAVIILAIVFVNVRYSSEVQHGFVSISDNVKSRLPGGWEFDTDRDFENYALTEAQCEAAFPGLFADIEDRVERRRDRPISREELTKPDEEWPQYSVLAMIYDGKLYVINAKDHHTYFSRVYTTLASLNRAILPFIHDRNAIPNVEFVFDFHDISGDWNLPIWSYTHNRDDNNTWLMPDFGFYSWPEPNIGTYDEVRRRMADVEREIADEELDEAIATPGIFKTGKGPFDRKVEKLFWRGAMDVDRVGSRANLMAVTKGMKDADVQAVDWKAKNFDATKLIPIEDHCQYKYLVHSEGTSWSGRLKYIQNCHSLIFIPQLDWQTPQYALLNPPMNQTLEEFYGEGDEDEGAEEGEDQEKEKEEQGGLKDRPSEDAFVNPDRPSRDPPNESEVSGVDTSPPRRRRRKRSPQGLPQPPNRNATSDPSSSTTTTTTNTNVKSSSYSNSQPSRSRQPEYIPGQNYVPVASDFSDLPEKLAYYKAHPDLAHEIATNNINTFRDRYGTPAAEACYWRKLVKGWAQVTSEAPVTTVKSDKPGDELGTTAVAGIKPEFYKKYAEDKEKDMMDSGARNGKGSGQWRGVPFESFWVMQELEW
ncbi:MAG: hypothetical protein M1831_001647 [Alyxoria varia]|nr:MAG: hypothetical protein M1831_001647 [Alyxoria varia]